MAAPTISTRVVPTTYKLPDGFKTTISSAAVPGIAFWEKTVEPGGLDGGELIPQSTMLNTKWHTAWPRTLIKYDGIKATVAYDPSQLGSILARINLPDSWTVHMPEGATISYYGVLTKFMLKALKEGDPPEADVEIPAMNYDYVNNVEQGPVFTASVGTA